MIRPQPPRPLRMLLLADTHLGFDMPVRPRVTRRRRGEDFFRNFETALLPALRGEVDVVVHGGDLFHHPRVGPGIVFRALDLLRAVSERGIPLIVVPGNHERSALPFPIFWALPNLHVIDHPRTVTVNTGAGRLAVAGFPFCRRDLAGRFQTLVEKTGWRRAEGDIRFLCIHQAVEGATVGPSDFVFRGGRDVITGSALPNDFAAILSGHIHRYQLLDRSLDGERFGAPVIYPGSVERTSIAEKDERKGYILLEAMADGTGRGTMLRHEFIELPARPMVTLDLAGEGMNRRDLLSTLRKRIARLDPESIVRLRLAGEVNEEVLPALAASSLRALAPPTMNLEIRWTAPRRE